jgi:hypothetical protein
MLSFAIKLILITVIEIKEEGLSQGKQNTFEELSWVPPSWKIFSRSAGFLTIVGYILRVTPIIMYQGWYLIPTLTPPITSNSALYKYINYVQHNCFNSWFFYFCWFYVLKLHLCESLITWSKNWDKNFVLCIFYFKPVNVKNQK